MPQRDGTATDNTDRGYNARGRQDQRRLPHSSLMKNPKLLRCPNCGGIDINIIADDSSHGVSGLVQFHCARPKCNTFWPEVQLAKPQVNDEIVRMQPRAGELWASPIDEVIELPR